MTSTFIVPEQLTMSNFITANKTVITKIVKSLYLKHSMVYQSSKIQLDDVEQCVLTDICKHWNIHGWTKEPQKLMSRMYELCRTTVINTLWKDIK